MIDPKNRVLFPLTVLPSRPFPNIKRSSAVSMHFSRAAATERGGGEPSVRAVDAGGVLQDLRRLFLSRNKIAHVSYVP